MAIPSFLVLSLGRSGQGNSGPECKSPIEELVGMWVLDWLVAYERYPLQVFLLLFLFFFFTISRN